MKKNAYLTALLFAVFVMTGCTGTGLSLRERGSFNYSNFVYGLYDKEGAPKSEKRNVNRPIKLAVAQVGENAPPQSLIDKLRGEHNLFSQVIPLPAGGTEPQYYGNEKNYNTAEFEEKMVKMRLFISLSM